ncbi:Uncharacterised protein [Mycobacteroides abscessus]|nr:Uncharacterised protein [Mycobacteroides abscessus]
MIERERSVSSASNWSAQLASPSPIRLAPERFAVVPAVNCAYSRISASSVPPV